MKTFLVLLSLLLLCPSVLFAAEKSYFLVCKDVDVTDKEYAINHSKGGFDENVINFKKGTDLVK